MFSYNVRGIGIVYVSAMLEQSRLVMNVQRVCQVVPQAFVVVATCAPGEWVLVNTTRRMLPLVGGLQRAV